MVIGLILVICGIVLLILGFMFAESLRYAWGDNLVFVFECLVILASSVTTINGFLIIHDPKRIEPFLRFLLG